MKLDFDICTGGRYNGKNITGIRYNGIDIFSPIGHYNAYTVEVLPGGNRTVEFDLTSSTKFYKGKEPYFDMGDGTVLHEDISSYTYNEPGTYLIITSYIIFEDTDSSDYNVVAINGVRRDAKSFYNLFSYSSLLEFNPININTSNITDMSWAFFNCSSLTTANLSKFNTSNVTKMNRMFDSCEALESLDISNFDTSNVTDIRNMFTACTALHTLYLNNCSKDTISMIITSSGFPTKAIEGGRYIYCKEENAAELTAPTNWQFSFI